MLGRPSPPSEGKPTSSNLQLRKKTCCLPLVEVKFGNDGILRTTLVENEVALTHLLKHLGPRVAVKTLEVHVRGFYDLLQINVPGGLHEQ